MLIKFKGISPIIAIILLIIVSIAIIGIILSWGKNFSNNNLSTSNFSLNYLNSDFEGFVYLSYSLNSNQMSIKNIHSYKSLKIKGYYILSDSKYNFVKNHYFDLNSLIEVLPNQEINFSIACTPSNDFILNLVLDDNSYVSLDYKNKFADLSSCISDVSIGLGHICALLSTGEVKCWGRNVDGQLGDVSYVNKEYPVYVCDSNYDCQDNNEYRLNNIKKISAGYHHTCALNNFNEVYCWGANAYGELGQGDFVKSNFALKVSSLNNSVKELNSGWGFNCALLFDGTAKCWGRNNWGCVGNGLTSNVNIPEFVLNRDDNSVFENIKEIKSTGQASYLKTFDNEVYFWGTNANGQWGDPNYDLNTYGYNYPYPVDHSFENYFLNYHHVCATNNDGFYYCFGKNNFGQLGIDSNINFNTPQKINIKFINFSIGGNQTCGQTSLNNIFCWGLNGSNGSLGNNSEEHSKIPVKVSINKKISKLFSGYQNSCALENNGDLYCWGSNVDGTLGNGTFDVSLIPTKVSSLLYN